MRKSLVALGSQQQSDEMQKKIAELENRVAEDAKKLSALGSQQQSDEKMQKKIAELNRSLDETQAKLDASPEAVRNPNQQQTSETESGEREGRRVEEKFKQELRAAEYKKAMEEPAKRITKEHEDYFINKEQKSHKEEGEIG